MKKTIRVGAIKVTKTKRWQYEISGFDKYYYVYK